MAILLYGNKYGKYYNGAQEQWEEMHFILWRIMIRLQQVIPGKDIHGNDLD
jgi:hypothetical protein